MPNPFLPALFILLVLLSAFGLAQEKQPGFADCIPLSPSTRAPQKIEDGYWQSQFTKVNQAVAGAEGTQVVFFGDSITLRWSLAGAEGRKVWEKQFADYRPINMGNSGDITPVMLYRIRNGNLNFPNGEAPQVAVLLCGTNNYVVTASDGGKVKWNLGMKTPPREVADGIRAVARSFRRHVPETRIILLGILPVRNQAKWTKCAHTNKILSSYHYPENEVVFLNLQDRFLTEDGTLNPKLFTDGTHLTPAGYEVMARALAPEIKRLIKLGPIQSSD